MATHIRLRSSSSRRGGFFKTFVLALLAAATLAGFAAAYLLFEFESPTLVVEKEIKYLGGKVELPLRVSDNKSGIRSLVITLTQGDRTAQLLEKTFPRQAWFKPAGPATLSEQVLIDAQKAGIKEGQAELVIAVRDFSLAGFFKGNETRKVLPVTMDTKPPKVTLLQAQRTITNGGSGMVLYTVSESPGRNGVQIDGTTFQGYPVGKKDAYVCYFALPWDAKQPGVMRLVVADEAGNETSLPLSTTFVPTPAKHDEVIISDHFLQQKMAEFAEHYPEMQGTDVEKYLYINNQVRLSNGRTIAQACATTDPSQFWSDRFLRMPGSGRAQFADQRTYFYHGSAIDNQTHLGVDIASLAEAEVRAANRGKVVFAGYLGIYGNMVVLDHGQGIASLYSHLSRIDTTVGTLVAKDQAIGRTGATGMAGGDHLHFSMLVHGIFVNPTQWWDQHWIDVNIKSALNAL